MAAKQTRNEFIQKAKAKHGGKYSYRRVVYVNSATKVEIYCRKCRVYFWQQPQNHTRGVGCRVCNYSELAAKFGTSNESFLARAIALHGAKYIYDCVSIVKLKHVGKIKIYCNACAAYFLQYPRTHLRGHGCPQCANNALRHTDEEFIRKAKKIHGKLYGYERVCFKTLRTPIEIRCVTCATYFKQTARQHLQGQGCPVCAPYGRQFSNLALRWLRYEAKRRRIKIQHALNGGEYKIPTTRLHADGYNARTNTVFEFYGDCYHGNPNIYSPCSTPHPYNNSTAKALYHETLCREQRLRDLGYTVVSMWEADFRELLRSSKVKGHYASKA